MDYVAPMEAVIPGVQGRVLGVLARTGGELTMRTVARLAGVSANRATAVLNRLVSLGLVQRRNVGPAALVSLSPDNEAARAIVSLAGLRATVTTRMRFEAQTIRPAPVSLVVFGSFAAGAAREASDIDVIAVRPAGVRPDDAEWVDSLDSWADRVARIAGNPVNLIEASVEDMPERLRRPGSVWAAAAEDGLTIAGVDLHTLGEQR